MISAVPCGRACRASNPCPLFVLSVSDSSRKIFACGKSLVKSAAIFCVPPPRDLNTKLWHLGHSCSKDSRAPHFLQTKVSPAVVFSCANRPPHFLHRAYAPQFKHAYAPAYPKRLSINREVSLRRKFSVSSATSKSDKKRDWEPFFPLNVILGENPCPGTGEVNDNRRICPFWACTCVSMLGVADTNRSVLPCIWERKNNTSRAWK